MTDPNLQSTSAWLQQALPQHQAGHLAEAEALYQRILAAEPEHAEALRLMGILARQRGQTETARGFLERALQVKPNSARTHYDLALHWIDRKELGTAMTLLERAVQLQPFFPEAHHALGNACAACWFLEKAKHCYRQALAQKPDLPAVQQCLEFVQRQERDLSLLAKLLKNMAPGAVHTSAGTSLRAMPLPARELFPHLLNLLGLTGVGAEVGVKEGSFSEHLLRHWEGRRLHSIDPWREFPTSEYVDSANVPQSQQDELYRNTIKRLRPFGERSVLWRLTSKEATGLLPDGSLDFCYVDADHSYEAVREDLQLWHLKVRPGGILAGHDYIADGTYSFGTFGVQRAVNEFVSSRNLALFLSQETPFRSWFVLKR